MVKVSKKLIVAEDISTGVGKEIQTRNNTEYEVTKLNATELQGMLVVKDVAELWALDTNNIKNNNVFVEDAGLIYSYNGTIWNIVKSQILKIDTISDFRAMTSTPDIVYVTGYHTKNDGAYGSDLFKLREGVVPNGTYDNTGTTHESVNGVYDLQYNILSPFFFGCNTSFSNNSSMMQKCFDIGGKIDLGENNIFNCFEPIEITKNTHLIGINSKIINGRLNCYTSVNIVIDGLELESTITNSLSSSDSGYSSVRAPILIHFYDVKMVSFLNNTFTNGLVYVRNSSDTNRYNVVSYNNTFNTNFSTYDIDANQEDCLTINGYKDIAITKNKFFVTDAMRMIKISQDITTDLTGVAMSQSSSILIEGNYIRGTKRAVTHKKQVIDLFIGSTNVTIRGNDIIVSGWESVIENKTAVPNTSSTELTRTINITGNLNLKSDGSIIVLQGSYGLTTFTPNSYDICKIGDNNLVNTSSSTASKPSIKVKFYHDVKIKDNTSLLGNNVESNINNNIEAGGNKNILLSGNSVEGYIYINQPVKNNAGYNFIAPIKSLKILNNTMNDYSYRGGIQLTGIASDNPIYIEDLMILGNTCKTNYTSNIIATVYMRNLNIEREIFTNNIGADNDDSKNRVYRLNVTEAFVLENNNTWDISNNVTN